MFDDEFEREVDKIIKELDAKLALEGLEAPEDLKQNVLDKIKAYESETESTLLSEEDKEALRLGRELLTGRAKQSEGTSSKTQP